MYMEREDVYKKLRIIAPEFENTPDDKLGVFFETAELLINFNVFGGRSVLAAAYYIAHLLTLDTIARSEGATSGRLIGDVVSEREGELQRQYAQNSSSNTSDNMLKHTYYGRLFIELRRASVIPVLTRMGGAC